MSARRLVLVVFAAVVYATLGLSAPTGATSRPSVELVSVAELDDGTTMSARPGDPRMFVAEQGGRIIAVDDDGGTTTVLDIADRVSAGGEQGLLGLTFSPEGDLLYVHFSNRNGDTRVEEYEVSRDGTAIVGTRRKLLGVSQPQGNHNGGQLAIGPDGMLYLGLGDGGSQGDEGPGHAPEGNGQSLGTLLGKILRIDPAPDGDDAYTVPPDNPFADGGGRPEIWSWGLRNPWRFSFDAETGDLWVADVGGSEWEEIDVVPEGDGAGRDINFGWNVFEAHERHRDGEPSQGDPWPPLISLSHDRGYCAVIGGYVYRGSRIAQLVGAYVFADYCNGTIRWVRQTDNEVDERGSLGVELDDISSFGQDDEGELYVLSQSDGLFRLAPA
jgi:glucose/arabinose dehydrogenase